MALDIQNLAARSFSARKSMGGDRLAAFSISITKNAPQAEDIPIEDGGYVDDGKYLVGLYPHRRDSL